MLLLVAVMFAISDVGANNMTDDMAGTECDGQIIEGNNIESMDSSNDLEILEAADDGTFTALQQKVDKAGAGATITLENDYAYDEGFAGTQGVVIDKSLTINGNGHVIDAASKSRFFTVNASITLNDIIFKNGYAERVGALYISNADYVNLKQCSFENNAAGNLGGSLSLNSVGR